MLRIVFVMLLVLSVAFGAGAGTDKEMVKGDPVEGGVNNP
jgi:hypothetical protein